MIKSLVKEITKDLDIKLNHLDRESARTNRLFSKYLGKYSAELNNLSNLQSALDRLKLDRSRYWLGTQTDEYYKKHSYVQRRILKTDLPATLKADRFIITAGKAVKEKEIIVMMLEKSLKQIERRNFEIKNIIDWKKLNGVI